MGLVWKNWTQQIQAMVTGRCYRQWYFYHICSSSRKIYGPTKENGRWRIKMNEELMTKYKTPDIVSIIKIQRLEWLGHMVRMNETRSVKKIFERKLEGRRGRGRPRLRWINDMEDDLRKLGVKWWRMKALEREEWTSIIKEAKAKLKGP